MIEDLKGISREYFDKFCETMWARLKMGEEKYGCEYDTMDVKNELVGELVDMANYSFMLYLRAMNIVDKYKKELNIGDEDGKN